MKEIIKIAKQNVGDGLILSDIALEDKEFYAFSQLYPNGEVCDGAPIIIIYKQDFRVEKLTFGDASIDMRKRLNKAKEISIKSFYVQL